MKKYEKLQLRYNICEGVWELWRFVYDLDEKIYSLQHQWHEYTTDLEQGCVLYAKERFPLIDIE